MDRKAISLEKSPQTLHVLCIHHSCGGQLLADAGPERELGGRCIYASHENGGGLRRLLAERGWEVSEACYGSEVGERTDLFDWLPKFRHKMDRLLLVRMNDELLADGATNRVVLFKSCFPNSRFEGEGAEPGDAAGPALTVANARATFRALRTELEKRPDVLFVYVTAPPLAPEPDSEPIAKRALKRLLGRPAPLTRLRESAALARNFNDWATSPDGWLRGHSTHNIAVFDYFDLLTDHRASNLSRYATRGGRDSHPSSVGNAKAAHALAALLERAVRDAGLTG